MMIEPNHSHIDERNRISEVRRPFLQKFFCQLPRRSVGPMNFEYKQRNNNGKGCITKSFEAIGRRKIILTSVRLHRRPTGRLNRFG